MKLLSLLLILYSCCTHAQTTHTIQLGDSTITFIEENMNTTNKILFINVHENEMTSVEAIRNYDVNERYHFVYLKHNGSRRIGFNHSEDIFTVDPNRIFTHEGIVGTLAYDSIFHNRHAEKLSKILAKEILKYVHASSWIISLHNNTPDNYSIMSYLPDSSEALNTKEVYINEKMDPDDFIYTTDLSLFSKLKYLQINVILQDNENCVDDGSLSVYCGKRNIPYANVEAEDGHLTEQIFLISELINHVHPQ